MDEIRLGSRTLQPGRQLLVAGRREPLGKRALDILSVLAEAGGKIVTKDELLEAVWPGVTVEENALQVHIVALRKALGPEADRLKTIRGVGYQLDIDGPMVAPQGRVEPTFPPNGPFPPRSAVALTTVWAKARAHRWALALATLLLVLVGTSLVVLRWPASQSEEIVRVEAFDSAGGEPARLLAQTLHSEILEVFNESRIQIASDERRGFFSTAPKANRVLRGTVIRSGRQFKANLVLVDVASGMPLWSKQFERDIGSADKLAIEASVAATRTIFAIGEIPAPERLKLDPETIALHIRGSELMRSARLLDEGTPRQIFEQVVARAPNSAFGHARLAMTWAGEARLSAPETRAPLIANARSAARKAIALNPASGGPAYDALYIISSIEHPQRIADAEDWLLAGLRYAPSIAWLHMRECQVLMGVGRIREAVPLCQRGLALYPFAEPIAHNYAWALSLSGQDRQAEDAIERAARYNPDHSQTRRARFRVAAFGARPEEARALLDDPESMPNLRRREAEVLARYLEGAGQWDERERRDLTVEMTGMALRGDMAVDFAVVALVSLGRLDEAFELLALKPREDGPIGVSFLFHPAAAPLRADLRFWPLAARLGLAQHWTTRGRWPDMCRDEFTLQFCKARTAEALARG